MRRILLVAAVSVLSVGLFLPFVGTPAFAEDLTPDQAARVKANCVSIKNSLNQLHVSDALLRVNRGQLYEAMGAKLMDPFNDHLGNNRLDHKAMVTVTTNYRTALADFRSDYIAYSQKLSDTIKIDCTAQPNSFHTNIEEARKLRSEVHADVKRLNRLLDDYRMSVSDFLLNYERVSQ